MKSQLVIENLNYALFLKNINFSLEEGTINALMGSSGSGKTTLLKSIFGLIKYEGNIIYKGIVLNNDKEYENRKKIGIYLGTKCLENKTVFLNLIEPLSNLNYSITKAKKKIYEISRKFSIDDLLYKEIDTLSHSQRKVVAFIQSIIHEPKIILIDNLFDSLDTFYKDKIMLYLNQLKKNKKSIIIFTTKNSEDLMDSDNLILLKKGKLITIGRIKELIKDENLFIKNDIQLPFIINLSYKLKSYELIDDLIYTTDEMADKIWQ